MAYLPKPPRPLNLLTIDGGGLQGISSLLILDELLKTIARSKEIPFNKLRPCDVFDVIAGYGTGGWLALLLGRFQLDIKSAMAEWYRLIDCIAPKRKPGELRVPFWQHNYYNPNHLVEQVDRLAGFYGTDKHMFFTPPEGTRCRHSFVSAVKAESKGSDFRYNLFRTYDRPESALVVEGLTDPRKCKISHAFAATGATKYMSLPWKEHSSCGGRSKSLDISFPRPRNITYRAVDESKGLYGPNVEISVVVNVGPGVLNSSDYRSITRKFSWGKEPIATSTRPSEMSEKANAKETTTTEFKQSNSFEKKLRMAVAMMVADIRMFFRSINQKDKPRYYRLAPEVSPSGTAQNDTLEPNLSSDSTMQYLRTSEAIVDMEEIAQHISV